MTFVRHAAKPAAVFAEAISQAEKGRSWALYSPTPNIWNGKIKKDMKKVPVIDLGNCTDCESCLEICPSIFQRNNETGLIEVKELAEYPEEDVLKAISVCPADCITLEEI